MRAHLPPLVFLGLLACTAPGGDSDPFSSLGGDSGDIDTSEGGPPPFSVGTWNLENFSEWGVDDWRLENVPGKIDELGVDLLAVQELVIEKGSDGDDPQAYDALLDALPSYDGVRNPWQVYDTSVGLLYRPDTVEILETEELFPDDSWAFPRPPLQAKVRIERLDESIDLTVIVLHLKARDDGLERRLEACTKLWEYLRDSPPDTRVVILGDLNDDPNDVEEENAFTGTFLDTQPDYWFLTAELPPESVTSTGWYHWVGEEYIEGSFIDHVIATGPLVEDYTTWDPSIVSVDNEEWDSWETDYSDHFPVLVDFVP